MFSGRLLIGLLLQENPFEVREEAASTQGTLTPPATPSTSGRADAMEDRIRDFQSFVAEYRKLERKLRASERSIAARDKTIDTLRETVEAQEKIVKAQKAQIAALKEDNEEYVVSSYLASPATQ